MNSMIEKDGIVTIGEQRFYKNAEGALIPESVVRPADKLEDDVVRKIIGYAEGISAQVARFKSHSFDDIFTAIDLINEKYGVKKGGRKGNVTFQSLDGCLKVQVKVANLLTFGPQLNAAKLLIDQCIENWSEGSRDELRALVNHAFNVDRDGRINHAALFQLRRVAIKDDNWAAAMDAIADAIRIVGSKAYLQFYRRDTPEGKWKSITVDLAAA